MEVTFTPEELNNLLIFLERVEMKGTKEAIALVNITNALTRAKEPKENHKTSKK